MKSKRKIQCVNTKKSKDILRINLQNHFDIIQDVNMAELRY